MITPDQFYKKTSEILGIDLTLSEKVNKFFWKNGVAENVNKCEHEGIYIKNIGTLYGSDIKTKREVIRVIRKLKGLRVKEKRTKREELGLILLTRKIGQLLKMRNKLALQKLNKTAQKWEWFENG